MKIIIRLGSTFAVIMLVVAAYVVAGFLVAPVYRFAPAAPFSGEHIYNPYDGVGDSTHWRRANFHAHTYLRFGLTYGAKQPAEVVKDYRSYGYEIIGLSNYHTITRYEPAEREEYNIPLYEHGYNPLLFHQLVFGRSGLTHFDIPLPLFTSQKQCVLNRVAGNADAVCINHPNFTRIFPPHSMNRLQGYRLIEAETGMASSAVYWDEGLSAGRASFCLSGDDSHNTDRPHDIATDMNFIASRSTRYADILEALLAGRHYAMKIPGFGDNPDTGAKREFNRNLPRVERINLSGDTIRLLFSESADEIIFTGQGGTVKHTEKNAPCAEYIFGISDTYIRVTAAFPGGAHIFLNPFFRYSGDDPFALPAPQVRIPATIFKDMVAGTALAGILWLIYRLIKPKNRYGKSKRQA